MCTTSAPAAAAASVLPPVYANKFNTRSGRPTAACDLARDLPRNPIPILALLRKHADLPRRQRFELQPKRRVAIVVRQMPLRRHPRLRHPASTSHRPSAARETAP